MSSSSDHASPEKKDRAERIRQITDECLRCWARGAAFSEAELIDANPDLQPELELVLQQIRRIAQAGADQDSLAEISSASAETELHEPDGTSSGCLHIRCPHCRNPVELLVDSPFTDITCDTCGSAFSLLNSEAQTCQAPPLHTLGHFELVSRLGIGAFGTVWKAHDIELDRTVAIKIPRRGQLDPLGEEQFLHEARVAAQLCHANIVSVHEVGREEDTLYIVSDLIRGVSLTEWLTAKHPLPSDSAILMSKIADALHYAHEQAVVHRDLKPSNVMMDRADEPHLLDFGLAKRNVGELTMTADGQILGTPAYMSPEQAEGESHHVDRRTDIYSLGVIFFELLTGELPFRGSAQMQIHQKVTDDAPSPRDLSRFVPRDLATICTKCLERDPNRRYATARELSNDLRRFVNSEPIHARPVSRVEKTLRWMKRNPGMATAAALTAILAVAGPTAAWRISEANQELAESLTKLDNSYAQMTAERNEANGRIEELQSELAQTQGNVMPAQFTRRGQELRRDLIRSLFGPHLPDVAERLQNENFDDEQTLLLELSLAIAYDEAGNSARAIEYYRKCIEKLEVFRAKFPTENKYTLTLVDCYYQIFRLQIPAKLKFAPLPTDAHELFEHARTAFDEISISEADPQALAEMMIVETYLATTALPVPNPSDNMHSEQESKSQLTELKRRLKEIEQAFAAEFPQNPTKLYELITSMGQRWPYFTHAAGAESVDNEGGDGN